MVYATEVERIMKECGEPVSSINISKKLGYDINDRETRFVSPSACAIKLNEMQKKGIVKLLYKKDRRNYYGLTTPTEQEEIKNKPKLPKLDSGEPIPEKYIPIFTVQPIDDDVCTTIQHIRYKILEDGFLTPEQEKYVNQILAKIVQEEQEV